jgi:hypothetical protein
MGVADAVSRLRLLAADIALLCHWTAAPESFRSCRANLDFTGRNAVSAISPIQLQKNKGSDFGALQWLGLYGTLRLSQGAVLRLHLGLAFTVSARSRLVWRLGTRIFMGWAQNRNECAWACDTYSMQSPLQSPTAATDPKSVKVNLTSGTGVDIEWADGHVSHYGFVYLRDACPCAMCDEERSKTGRRPGDPAKTALRRRRR